MAEQGPGGSKIPSVFLDDIQNSDRSSEYCSADGAEYGILGHKMRRILSLTVLIFFRLGSSAMAAEPSTLLGDGPPYVPRKTDYSLELGLMSARDDLFWAGAMMGAHLGPCVFSASETCQQFVDGIIGVAVREGETQGHFWLSPRWQYVNFPARFSPFWRVFGGIANIARPENRGMHGVFGGGAGVTTYLHDKVDLHAEARWVATDRVFYQVLLGINVKADRLLEYFAVKLKELGVGTVRTAIDATGTAIEATGEGLGGLMRGVISPFKKEEPAVTTEPVPTPAP